MAVNVTKTLSERIQAHEAPIMKRKFPQFALFQGDPSLPFASNGELFWGGTLTTNFGSSFSVAVVYPVSYPHGQTKVFVRELMGVRTPHKYVDGHLCLYSNDHGGGGEGIGTETTAAALLGWAAAWLNAWEVYQRSGNWPGR